jgi:hypothetical protein
VPIDESLTRLSGAIPEFQFVVLCRCGLQHELFESSDFLGLGLAPAFIQFC